MAASMARLPITWLKALSASNAARLSVSVTRLRLPWVAATPFMMRVPYWMILRAPSQG